MPAGFHAPAVPRYLLVPLSVCTFSSFPSLIHLCRRCLQCVRCVLALLLSFLSLPLLCYFFRRLLVFTSGNHKWKLFSEARSTLVQKGLSGLVIVSFENNGVVLRFLFGGFLRWSENKVNLNTGNSQIQEMQGRDGERQDAMWTNEHAERSWEHTELGGRVGSPISGDLLERQVVPHELRVDAVLVLQAEVVLFLRRLELFRHVNVCSHPPNNNTHDHSAFQRNRFQRQKQQQLTVVAEAVLRPLVVDHVQELPLVRHREVRAVLLVSQNPPQQSIIHQTAFFSCKRHSNVIAGFRALTDMMQCAMQR